MLSLTYIQPIFHIFHLQLRDFSERLYSSTCCIGIRNRQRCIDKHHDMDEITITCLSKNIYWLTVYFVDQLSQSPLRRHYFLQPLRFDDIFSREQIVFIHEIGNRKIVSI